MSTTSSSAEHDPLQPVADDFLDRLRQGEHPSLSGYKARFPDLAERIDELFPALAELELVGSDAGSSAGVSGRRCRGDVTAERLGDFRILREVGRGGMGVVYEAIQESLGRRVALKVLPRSGRLGGSRHERFRLEARTAARLHHSNIVPVYGVGEHEGAPYYAMQFISGVGLDSVLDERQRLRSGRSWVGADLQGGRPCAPSPLTQFGAPAAAGPAPTRRSRPAPDDRRRPDRADRVGGLGVSPGRRSDRRAGSRGVGARPRPGRLASRHQAVEPAPRPRRRRLGHRLRAGEGGGQRRPGCATGGRARHAPLHGAGAVQRLVRPPERRLRAGRHPLRAGDPPPGLRG